MLYLSLGIVALLTAMLVRQSLRVAAPQVQPTPAPTDIGGQRIGVLVVAYNAVGTLAHTLKRIPADVWQQIDEIAVFDDHSPDDTFALAVGYRTLLGSPKLKVFRNAAKLGYGGNQKAGYEYFRQRGFDVVVLLHADGQYAPELLADVYGPVARGEADAAFGTRMTRAFGSPLAGGMPLYKWLGIGVLTRFANAFLGMELSEFHCGYRAYSLQALAALDLSRTTDDFHFDTEMVVKLQHQGFRIVETPIPAYRGVELGYMTGVRYAWNVYCSVMRYRATLFGLRTAPEYAEYAPHYPLKTSRHSSHDYFTQIAAGAQRVLDVGCGEGYFAETIRTADREIVGVDCLERPKLTAAFSQYIQADLDGGLAAAQRALGERRFDLILLQDVLEHLRGPERLLVDCLPLLEPAGRIAVSVPNVANVSVRLALLLGRFEYTPRGILDRTHVRFFTRRTARRMLEDCGYRIVRQTETVIPVELALGMRASHPLMVAANRILWVATRLMPGLFGYQTLLIARPAAVAPAEQPVSIPMLRAA